MTSTERERTCVSSSTRSKFPTALEVELDLPSKLELSARRPDRDRVELSLEQEILGLRLEEATLQADGAVARLSLMRGMLELSIDTEHLEVELRDVDLGSLPSDLKPLVPIELRPLSGAVSFNAQIDFPIDVEEDRIEVQLQADAVSAAGLPPTRIRVADLQLQRSAIEAGHIELRNSLAEADLKQLRLALPVDPETAALGLLSVKVPDLAEVAHELEREEPLIGSFELQARRAVGEDFVVEDLRWEEADSRLLLSGTLSPKPLLEDWRESVLAFDLDGRLATATLRRLEQLAPDAELEGDIVLEAKVAGTLRAPEVEARVEGESITHEGRPFDAAIAKIRYAGDVVSLKELDLRAEGLLADGKASFDLKQRAFESEGLSLRANALESLNKLFPAAPELKGSIALEFEGSGELATWRESEARLRVEGRSLAWEDVDLGSLDTRGEIRSQRLVLEALRLEGPLATVDGDANIDLREESESRAGLNFELRDLSRLMGLPFDIPQLAGRLDGRLDARARLGADGSVHAASGELKINGNELVVDEQALGKLQIDAQGNEERVELSSLTLDGPLMKASAQGQVDLASRRFSRALGDASVDVPALSKLPLATYGIESPPLTGSLSLRADAVEVLEDGSLLSLSKLRLLGESLSLDERALGRISFEAGGAPEALAWTLNAEGPEGRASGRGQASLADPMRVARLVIEELQIDREDYRAALVAELGLRDTAQLDLPSLTLKVEKAGHALAELQASGSADEPSRSGALSLSGHLDASALPPDLLPVDGKVDFAVEAKGSLEAPLVELTANSERISYRDLEAALTLSARYADELLDLETFKLAGGERLNVDLQGRLPLSLDAPIDPFALRGQWRAHLSEPLSLSPEPLPVAIDLPRVEIEGAASEDAIRIDVRAPQFSGNGLEAGASLALALRPSGSKMDAELTSDHGNARIAASLAGHPELLLEGDPQALLDLPLEATIDAEVPDFSPLRRVSDLVSYLRGSADIDLRINGSPRRPELSGALSIREGALRLRNDVPTIDRLGLNLDFRGDRAEIAEASCRLGYAPLRIEGGFDLADLLDPGFGLRVQGENVMLARTPDLRLRSDLDLELDGRLSAPRLAGRITVTDGLYTKPLEMGGGGGAAISETGFQLFSFESPEVLAKSALDLQIEADETFLVRNNIVRGRFSADLAIGGTAALPRPARPRQLPQHSDSPALHSTAPPQRRAALSQGPTLPARDRSRRRNRDARLRTRPPRQR